MNWFQLFFHGFKTVITAALMLGISSNTYAINKDCWAEFFQDVQYAGPHIRLEGPSQLSSLTNLNGENWDKRIESLKVGPKARVVVFEHPDFKLTLKDKEMASHPDLMRSLGITEQQIKEDSEDVFDHNQMIHDLSDFHFTDKIRSLKIDCIK
jgi:hypothetical protein